MSYQYYSELWLATREDVEKLVQADRDAQEVKKGKSKKQTSTQLIPLYIRYRELIRRLALCHDQVCQSQKRELIKRVLDCAIGRMLEYKHKLLPLQCIEATYADDILIAMKLTPDNVAWRKPSYFVTDRQSHLDERKKYINDLIEQKTECAAVTDTTRRISRTESGTNASRGNSKISARSTDTEIDHTLALPLLRQETPEEVAAKIAHEHLKSAVLLIQMHERARRGRVVGMQLKFMNDYNKKLASGELQDVKQENHVKMKAATTIQKWWRSYATRLHLKERTKRLESVLGMTIPSWRSRKVFDKDEENFKRRLTMQPEYLAATLKATSDENARVHCIRGPGLMEDITDEIREWFILWYDELGFFDAYPVAQAGGSVLVATGQTRTPDDFRAEQLRKADEAKKSKGKSGTKEKPKVKPKQQNNQPEDPKTLKGLMMANEDFLENWKLRDESGNPLQREYMDLITSKLCYELQLEMREVVDELMRLELVVLEAALAKDGGGQQRGKTEKKSKKKKNENGKSKGNSKKSKDPEADPTINDLFAELVTKGIIHPYPEVSLSDWKGDVSYRNVEARRELREPGRCLGDVVQPIMEYCVLPIGSREIHQVAPLIRSVSIVGLPRSGKSFLANAICNEIGALLFDLSPKIVAEHYVTKKDLTRLITLVNKVARAFPPSVIFVDAGHQPWWKKVPAEEKANNPKRLASPLTKLIKGIRPGDQILFLTTSDQPHKAGRPFTKIHDKFILIPLPDYNSLFLLYKELLMRYHGVDRKFNCSSLATNSVGLSLEVIRQVVNQVLTIERRITLKKQPLKPKEIMERLIASNVEVPMKEYENLLKWEKKTPLGKARAKMEAEAKRILEAENAVKKTKGMK